MRIDIEIMEIKRIAEHISAQYPGDEELLADMVEGETDLHSICRNILEKIEHEKGMVAALKEQVANRNERKARAEARQKAYRAALIQLMDAGRQSKLTLPEATLSRGTVSPKPVVVSLEELPEEYKTYTPKADMSAIKDAEELPPGVAMDNGGDKLTVRMK